MQRFQPETVTRAAGVKLLLLDVDGVLTDGTLYLGESVEMKGFNIQDGLGISLLRRAGIHVGILTGRSSAVVERRARELEIPHVRQGCTDKATEGATLCETLGITLAETAFMGDDLIDLRLLSRVGLAVAVPAAPAEVKRVAHHVTRVPGGSGAVREVCELILKAQGRWEAVMERYS